MKPAAFIGIALIIVGILSFVYQESVYTAQAQIIDLITLIAGFVLLVTNSNEPLSYRQ